MSEEIKDSMMGDWKTKDSGERRTFDTGAVRDVNAGKGRFDLISPITLARLAGVLERGAAKYEARNWEKGIEFSSFVNSAMRHLNQWANGETDEDHLAQAMWNIHSLIHTEQKVKDGKLPRTLANMGPSLSAEMVDISGTVNLREFLKK
jgi:hypothetical protein